MSRLGWALTRIPVSLLAAAVRRMDVLPKPPGERSGPESKWAPAALGLGLLDRAASAGGRGTRDAEGRWQELRNKVEAFASFRAAGDPRADIAEGSFADLWRREGRGYLHGRALASGASSAADGAPPARRDRIPHHTGMGLGLAAHHLERLRRPPAVALEREIDSVLEACRRWSMPGYAAAAVEALGLTVRLLQPALLSAAGDVLGARAAPVRQLFWHGVGRGIYLEPVDLAPAPDDRWHSLERVLAAAGDAAAQASAVAGLAWATTLVNIRHPEIIARRLRHPGLSASGEAVADGVTPAVLLWRDAVGDDAVLRSLLGYRPAADAEATAGWCRLVVEPTESALANVYPGLAAEGRLGALFSYRRTGREPAMMQMG